MTTIPQDHAVNVLFVCLGNICRSPTAEGVFRNLIRQHNLSEQIYIDSAGTSAYHLGEPPDQRAQAAAKARGIDLTNLRARQTGEDDFARFDYIIAMDNDNLVKLKRQCPAGFENRIRLFLEYAPGADRTDRPDPYTSDSQGFELVLDLIEQASQGLLEHIQSQSRLKPQS
jgi:protein-tyrosine phosphatase